MTAQTADYMKLPLEQFNVRDLTDALGVAKSAELLGTTRRAVYTTRNTNCLGMTRVMRLIEAIRADEVNCRTRLVLARNLKRQRVEALAA